MDKKAIKEFAVNARIKLRNDVISKLATLDITKDGIGEIERLGNDTIKIKLNEFRVSGKNVSNLEDLISELDRRANQMGSYTIAFDALVEEVAYTWFNRLIAIRYMEVNDYLSDGHRILSSETTGKKEPDVITHLFDTDIYSEFDQDSKVKITQLISDGSVSAMDELYQLVFIKQCNSLNKQLPDLFEKTDDYTELLFTISYIDDNGVIASLLTIPEDDFNVEKGGQVEIIGWMYQYYNTEPKDKVFARGNRKIRADEIPAATQLFTPDWIVRYMVENSLGRYYIDQKLANPLETRTEKEIANEFGWKYYLPTAEQPEGVQLQIVNERKEKSDFALQELKIIDPSMGSGHILVYTYDLLIQLYVAEGFRVRDAAKLILEHNLFGLDIDKRAFQLTYFALMMKGRQYSRRILTKSIKPKVYAVPDNYGITETELQLYPMEFPNKDKAYQDLLQLIDGFKEGANLGSLLEIEGLDFSNLKSGLDKGTVSFLDYAISEMIEVAEVLQQKYHIGITNPPYLGSSGMNNELSNFVKKFYRDSKSDLFGVFIERLAKMITPSGYYSMITQHAWMFLSSFEKLRSKINRQTILNMAHLGTRAFEEIGGEVVQTTAFVMSPTQHDQYVGSYLRLVDFGNHELKEEKVLKAIKSTNVDYLYLTVQDNFKKIPGAPISYWVSENEMNIFDQDRYLPEYFIPKTGLQTGDNNLFLRQWTEVDYMDTNIKNNSRVTKFQKINTGGDAIKWYGNLSDVILWENNGLEIKKHKGSVIRNEKYYYHEGISWKRIGSTQMKFKYLPPNMIFDQSGDSMFPVSDIPFQIILGYLNSPVAERFLTYIAPTLNLTAGNLSKLPVFNRTNSKFSNAIIEIVDENIANSKRDFDNFETSWDFKKHHLI